MKLDIELENCSMVFISELAKMTTSAEILDQITEYAIADDYASKGPEAFEIEHCDYPLSDYMESVLFNENISEETLIKIILHFKSEGDQLALVDRNKLFTARLLELFAENVNYLYPVEIFFKKYLISEEIANVIVSRIINGEINMDMDGGDYTDVESIEGVVKSIGQRCSIENSRTFEVWWESQRAQLVQSSTLWGDIIAERIMDADLHTTIPKRSMFMDNSLRNLRLCCSDEVGERLTFWWEEQKRKNKLR